MHPASFLLQAAADPITLQGLALQYAEFLAYFGIFGTLGYRFFVLGRIRPQLEADAAGGPQVTGVLDVSERNAARVGIVGAILLLFGLLVDASGTAAEKGISMSAAIQASGRQFIVLLSFGVLLLILFTFALQRVRAAWVPAGLIGIALALRNAPSLKWAQSVNPLHVAAASVWLGTLFVLVVAGLPAVLNSPLTSDRRGALIADLIARFSPVALCSAAVLGITGVITAWRHLKFVAALWTTSYGYALDLKLCVVAIVLALGAWNWRRMSPRLGSESAAHQLRRSAKAELSFAAIVLAITAVLVSLPGPKLPHP